MSYRRKIPSSISSESLQTPDSDASPGYSHHEQLVQEALYVLTGKSGKFLKKDITGEFKPDIKARNLHPQDALSLLRFSEIGQLHNKIQKYCDPNSEFFLCGLFGQGLISQVEAELVQFYGLMAHMQDNVSFYLENLQKLQIKSRVFPNKDPEASMGASLFVLRCNVFFRNVFMEIGKINLFFHNIQFSIDKMEKAIKNVKRSKKNRTFDRFQSETHLNFEKVVRLNLLN